MKMVIWICSSNTCLRIGCLGCQDGYQNNHQALVGGKMSKILFLFFLNSFANK